MRSFLPSAGGCRFSPASLLVGVGLYVRLTITETPVFREALKRSERVEVPMVTVFRDYAGTLVLGVLVSLAAFQIFYLMTVFTLSYGTSALGYSREKFLVMQLFAILFFALFTPISALLAERGRRKMLIWVDVGIFVFGLMMAPLFVGRHGRRGGDDGARHVAGGPDLRTARHRAVGAVSDDGALFRQLADLQSRRHLRRLARAVRGDLSRQEPTACSTSAITCARGAALSLIGLAATRETAHETL